MVILAIVILVGTFIYGVLEMNKSSKKISKESMRELKSSERTTVVAIVKGYWKVAMILLAIVICFMFIMISQLIGKTVEHSNVVSIIAICYSIVAVIVLMSKKKN